MAPTRTTRQADDSIIEKAGKTVTATVTVKGGKGVMSAINTACAVVSMKLGKYAADYIVLRTDNEVIAYFDEIIKSGFGAVDTETTSLDPMLCTIAGVCLYTPGMKAAYIPINHVSYITNVKLKDQISPDLMKAQFERCNESNVKWIMHNAVFDTRVIHHQIGITIPCFWDVYLAARCLNENEPAGLKELHLQYCDSNDTEALTYTELFSGIPFTLVPISTAYLYAAGDAVKTFELYEFQKQYLNRRNLPGPYSVFADLEMPLVPVVAAMEDAGMALDFDFCKYLSEKYNAELKVREEAFNNTLKMYQKELDAYKAKNPNHILSDPILITSSKQIAVLLYDVLQLPSVDKEKPRGTGEEILEKMDSPMTKVILDYRETAKLLSTYVDKMPEVINPFDKRVHCKFNQCGAKTGRFSSSDPNMQNIPSHNKEIRKMFRATEGYLLISADLSQQEPRTLAHVSGDEDLIRAYKDGKDIYAWIASTVYNVPYEDCMEFFPDGTKNPIGKERRGNCKSIVLGIMYGRGAKAIGEQIGCSTKKAQEIVDKFFKTYPKVQKFIDSTVENAKKTGYVETVWGRKRRLPDMMLEEYEFTMEGTRPANFDPLCFDDVEYSQEVDEVTKQKFIKMLKSAYGFKEKANVRSMAKQQGIIIKDNGGFIAEATRQCVNSVIQGTSADMIKRAMILIGNDAQLKEWGFRLLLQVHDELIGEAPAENVQKCAERFTGLMIAAAAEKIKVPMKCDAEITEVWYGEEVA